MQSHELERGVKRLLFEIFPVLWRNYVCGHSPRDRLTLPTEFRWVGCWKSLNPSCLSPRWKQANWLSGCLSRFFKQPPYTIKGDSAGFLRKPDDRLHLREQTLKGAILAYSVQSWKNRVLWDFHRCIYEHYVSNQAYWPFCHIHKIFIAVEHITGCIPYSHCPLWKIISFSEETWKILYFIWYDRSLNAISVSRIYALLGASLKQKSRRWDEMEVILHLILNCRFDEFLVPNFFC